MLANYNILTVTHKKTNLKEIGDFVLKAPDQEAVRLQLEALKQQFHIKELLYLPTCNRVMYFFTTSEEVDERFISHFFQRVNPDMPLDILNSLDETVYHYQGQDALSHLFDVAASIDSLVIGERQILRQLREAYEQSQEQGLTGEYIRLAFQQAVVAAKAVYNKTRIGDKPVSVVSLAFQQMLRAHVHKDGRVLLVGAGQTNQLVGKFLSKYGFSNVTVFNRSVGKAEQLAATLGGKALPLADIREYREGFDCLVVCTGATEPVITNEVYSSLLNGEAGHKVVIDLSIPNNVDEATVAAFDFEYIEIEGLRNLAKQNLAFREREIERAHKVIADFLAEMPALLQQRQIELAMRTVPVEIKAVKDRALNEVFHKEVALLDEPTKALMEKMLAYMEKKCIGIPMKAAREAVLR
ncbi:glutamyl-tRNA reductase [Phaeodactylibacter luteus]|uniref:Glutamyl-tRNA reductase n=1 Tax=Phaeodactylibacter luteus TaxID=1564516 RepID=A0A5C6RHC5_9BACT|nr:glutamyl-tRNA reductase [Phaeodactylibacter luteus]TXB61858.1 glutamyl-tRNA reductase [Phaeodactylibacter luteus]